jgi:hypothetical protein
MSRICCRKCGPASSGSGVSDALVQLALAVLLVEVSAQVGLHAGRADLQHPRRRIEALVQLGDALDALCK